MTTLDSSLEAESSMDGGSDASHLQTQTKTCPFTTTSANSRCHSGLGTDEFNSEGEDGKANEEDTELWKTFSQSFCQVQSVLDRNRVLIQQVNENHQSKIPDNLVKNVALIQEINGNISKVVSLYSDLSSNFLSMFHQNHGEVASKNGGGKGESMEA